MAIRAFDGLLSKSMGLLGLADHETELDSSQSDRLMMTTAATSASITQRAVAPSITGVSMPEKFLSALDIPMSKKTIAEKGYVVGKGAWTTSQVEGTEILTIKFPSILKNDDYAINGLLSYHEYLRCGIDLLIQINPTEWQMGGLVAWIESCQDDTANTYTNFNNIPTYPSGFLNCNVNNEVRIKQPFVYSRNHYMLHGTSVQPDNLFVLRVAVWSRLSVATGTSTEVSYKVTATLRDVVMHGIRPRATTAQMVRTIMGDRPSPGIQIDCGIGLMNTSNHKELRINAHMSLGCEAFEMDSSFSGGVESKDFGLHMRTPCRFDEIKWSTTTHTAGTRLAVYRVHPRQPANSYTTWPGGKCSTNLSLITSLYRYWRGDLVFTFQVFATKWHSGRLIVAFTPGPTEILSSSTSLEVVSTCSAAEYDIHGPQSTFTYRVPYISAMQYMNASPTKGSSGYLHVYVYNRLAAPNNVSTTVNIVVSMCGADNFELFVPSYNAVQAGEETAAGTSVPDVQEVQTVTHGTQPEKVRTDLESPMGAIEMPQYKPDKTGVFPQLMDGTRLHKESHTDLINFLGRPHHWISFQYSQVQQFINDQSLSWPTINGTLGAVAKCFTLFRGGLKLVVQMETTFKSEVFVAFRPTGAEPITTLEQLMKYGVVSMSSDQTHQFVLKLPWYQPQAANSIWATGDGIFGYVSFGCRSGGFIRVNYALAFDVDSHFYFPRGCPVDSVFHPATKSRAMRYARVVPDGVSTDDSVRSWPGAEASPQVDALLDWTPSEVPSRFLRNSIERRASRVFTRRNQPQAKIVQSGHWLCRTADAKWPMKHYFVLLADGRQFGFVPVEDVWVGAGRVKEEHITDYELVEAATNMAEALPFIVGVFYRSYHILQFNCEHFARLYSGLPEECTQLDTLTSILGVATYASAIGPMSVQMEVETTEQGVFDKLADALKRKKSDEVLPELPNRDWEGPIWEPRPNVYVPPLEPPKKSGFMEKVATKLKDAVKDATMESADALVDRTQKSLGDWVQKILMPSISATGLKITQKVICAVTKLVQSGCLIYVMATHPVPSVIAPLSAIAALEGLGGFASFAMKGVHPQLADDPDVTSDLAAMVYESVATMVPQAKRDSMSLRGFLTTLKDVSILASGLRSVITLGKWIVALAQKVIEYFFPTEVTQCARALSAESDNIAKYLAVVSKVSDDGDNIPAEALECLVKMGLHYWTLCIKAIDILKNRVLSLQVEKAYVKVRDILVKKQKMGDGLPRIEPVVIWLYGPKASGKSISSVALASAICKMMSWNPRKEIYTKPVSARYYDGYKCQKIMIMDDVGQNTGATGTDFDDFCQLVSTAPLRLNMADLADKGTNFTTPIIIASSNQADPAPNTIADTDAIRRRICDHRYMVRPRSEYSRPIVGTKTLSSDGKTSESVALDLAKAKTDEKMQYMDCCHFTIGLKSDGPSTNMKAIAQSVVKTLNRRTEIHNDLLSLWFTMSEQMGPDERALFTDYKCTPSNHGCMLDSLVKEFSIDKSELQTKVLPTWARVLLGFIVALGLAATLVGASYAVYTLAQKSTTSMGMQAAYNNTAVMPAKVPRLPSPMSQVPQSVSNMVEVVRDHLVRVGFHKGETLLYKIQGLAVRGLQVLVPSHFVHASKGHNILIVSREKEYEYAHEDVTFTMLKWDGKSMDACIMTLPAGGMQPYKDITKHFIKAKDLLVIEGSQGLLATRGNHGFTVVAEQDIHFFDTTSYTGSDTSYSPSGVFVGQACTYEGMCGGGLVSGVNKLQNPILGIHVAGDGNEATTQAITQEMFSQVPQAGRIRRVDIVAGMAMPSKTKFHLSRLAPYYSSGKCPALLYSNSSSSLDIYCTALTKYGTPLIAPPNDWHVFEKQFINWFTQLHGRTQGRLTLREALNGCQGLDRVNVKTSAGYPWCVSGVRKQDLLTFDGLEWHATGVLEDSVCTHLTQVEAIGLDDLDNDDGQYPIMQYVTYYKDELRPKEKVLQGKTRIIEAAPFHHVVAFRRVFGRAMARLHQSELRLGFAPGCDIEVDARQLAEISSVYPSVYDMDYSNFDGTLQPFVIRSAMRALGAIGCVNELDCDRWAHMLISSHHVFGDTRLWIYGGMPSGSPATTMINTISNMMMVYYGLGEVNKWPMSRLRNEVKLVAYGDDLLMFGGINLAGCTMMLRICMNKRFGAITTSADKTEIAVTGRKITEVQFLKRTFRPNPECPWMWHARLDMSSIVAMVEYECEHENYKDRLEAAMRFAAHWGPKHFNKLVSEFHRLPRVEQPYIPEFSELIYEWMNKVGK